MSKLSVVVLVVSTPQPVAIPPAKTGVVINETAQTDCGLQKELYIPGLRIIS
ncbi:MAG TPA: hypothetical protein PLN52_23905 [Opitutaceae bacterium]|nr:hypothetical protein [Opitutaceae bacterium]